MALPEVALSNPVGKPGAPLVVLGHSLGTGPLIWESVVPVLKEHYRVSLLELPGHGTAPVPGAEFTMEELADAVRSAASNFVSGGALYAGVSIGGALALMLAKRHPDFFAGVVSVASAASLGGEQHWRDRAAMVRLQSTSALVAPSSKAWFAPEAFVNEPEIVGRILRVLQEVSDEGYARCAEALATYNLVADLPKIEIPVLAIGGAEDPVAPRERQEEIAGSVQQGRYVIVPGAGHQTSAEKPVIVAAELLEFFAEVTK